VTVTVGTREPATGRMFSYGGAALLAAELLGTGQSCSIARTSYWAGVPSSSV